MKRWLIVVLITGFCLSQLVIAKTDEQEVKEIKAQISKIRVQISQIKNKAKSAPKAKQKKFQNEIDSYQVRIDKLIGKLAALEKQKIAKQKKLGRQTALSQTLEVIDSEEVVEIPSFETESVSPIIREKRTLFQVGGNIGLFAGVMGGIGELRLPLGKIVGPAKLALRFSGGLLQNDDMSKRYAPIMFDCLLNFPAGWFTGVENYLGIGGNYICRMTGGQAGTIGGQLCYGIESDGFGGKLYGELGWAILRTGFSPSQKGTTVLFGYRLPWKN